MSTTSWTAGGFISVALAQRKSLGEIAVEYEHLRQAFAQQNALMTEVKRFAVGASHSTNVVDDSTRRFFGRLRMTDLPPSPKVFVVCAAVDAVPPQPYLFRSYELTPEAFAASEFMGTANVFTHVSGRGRAAAGALCHRSSSANVALIKSTPVGTMSMATATK